MSFDLARRTRDAKQPVMERIKELKQSIQQLERAANKVDTLKERIEQNNRMIALAQRAIGFTVTPVPPHNTTKIETYEFGPDHRIADTIVEFLKAENSQLEVLMYDALNAADDLVEEQAEA